MALKIGYRDYWSQGTILAWSSQDPQFLPQDTQVDVVTQSWRTAPGTTSGTIDCDILSAVPLDTFAILGHNYTAGATIQLIGADDSAFSTNVVTETVTWAASNIYGLFSTTRTKRYWRLSISDAGNGAGYLETGVIRLYQAWAPGRPFLATYQPNEDSASTAQGSSSRDVFADAKPVLDGKTLPFAGMSDADLATVLDLQKVCDILVNAFIIIFDDTAPSASGWFVYLLELTVPEPRYHDYNNFTLVIRKVAQ